MEHTNGRKLSVDVELAQEPSIVRSLSENHDRCQIVYKDLKYSVQVKEKGSKTLVDKVILKGINGIIEPSRLTACMGASGAGKTTFLNVLAGHAPSTAKLGGSIKVNGDKMEAGKMRQISGFVHQEDVILDTMTVREALTFSAVLKLPSSMPHSEKVRRALDIAELLNLGKSLDSVVGSALIKGISGGEKRRLSLGMEMVTNPSILFLDEPTSGLDSFTAFKVARILRSVASTYNRTILCTIHQPSSEVFSLFDDLVVLADGCVVFHGPVPDMVPYFGALGYSCPNNFNPADFLFMEVLNKGATDADEAFDFIAGGQNTSAEQQAARGAEAARVAALISAWQASKGHHSTMNMLQRQLTLQHGVHESAIHEHAAFFTQFNLLSRRAAHNAWRNQLIIKGKLAQTIFLSIIVGLIFLRIDLSQKSIQDRQGSLFFLIVQGLFGSVMGILTIFGGEKAVFQREYRARMYGLPAYFISRTLVELPSHIIMPILSCLIVYWMVGYQNQPDKFFWFMLINVLMDNCGTALGIFVSCLFNDISMALSVMPMFLLPLMVFSGFFVNATTLGWWFRWISYISPMKYGFIALAKNEFAGLTFELDENGKGTATGEEVIELLGFDGLGSVGVNAGVLFALFWGFLLLAYVALWAAVRRMNP